MWWSAAPFRCALYKYMGRYCPDEWKKRRKVTKNFFYNTRMLFSYCKMKVLFTAMQSPISPISDNCRMRVYLSPSRACSVRAACAPLTGSLHFLLSQVSPSPLGWFVKSDVLFCGKRRVVLWKVTCRFIQNNVLFLYSFPLCLPIKPR